MVDMSSIVALAGSLKTAADITKTVVEIRDATKLQAKVIELQSVILTAQSNALSSQQDQFTLIEEVRPLKQQISDLEQWNREAEGYELKQIDSNAFAYMKKPTDGEVTPSTWLCTNCWEKKSKSILQYKGRSASGQDAYHQCPRCNAQVTVHWKRNPQIPYSPA